MKRKIVLCIIAVLCVALMSGQVTMLAADGGAGQSGNAPASSAQSAQSEEGQAEPGQAQVPLSTRIIAALMILVFWMVTRYLSNKNLEHFFPGQKKKK